MGKKNGPRKKGRELIDEFLQQQQPSPQTRAKDGTTPRAATLIDDYIGRELQPGQIRLQSPDIFDLDPEEQILSKPGQAEQPPTPESTPADIFALDSPLLSQDERSPAEGANTFEDPFEALTVEKDVVGQQDQNRPLTEEELQANQAAVAERAERGKQMLQLVGTMLEKVEASIEAETPRGLYSYTEGVGEKPLAPVELRQARRALKDILAGSKKSGSAVMDFMRGMGNIGDEMIPFIGVLPGILENINLTKVMNKPAEERTAAENQLIEATALLNEFESQGYKGNAFEYGQIFGMMLPYAAEFALTQPQFRFAQAGVRSGIERVIGKGLATRGITGTATKALSNISGSVLQSTVNAQRWVSEGVRRMTPQAVAVVSSDADMAKALGIDTEGLSEDKKVNIVAKVPGEGLVEAFSKAYGLNLSEFLTERWGSALGVGSKRLATSKLGKALLNPEHFKYLTAMRFMEKTGLKSLSQTKKLMNRVGWHGVLTEVWGEEYPNMIINAQISGDQDINEVLNPLNEDLLKMVVPAMVFQGVMMTPQVAKNISERIEKLRGELPEEEIEPAAAESAEEPVEPETPEPAEEVAEEDTGEPTEDTGTRISKDNKVVKDLYQQLIQLATTDSEGADEASRMVDEFDTAQEDIREEWVEISDNLLTKYKDAIQERGPEKVHVGESPEDSTGDVGQDEGKGDKPEKPAIPREEAEEETPVAGESQIKPIDIPTVSIEHDLKRFQTRRKAYSEESVQKIVSAVKEGTFNIKKFDPIRVWKDPKNGRTYVLAGHSRMEAYRRLSEEGVEGFENIPSIDMSELSEEEAIQYAKRESNVLATQESALDVAKMWKEEREGGKSATQIREENKGRANLARLELLSYINPEGKTAASIDATNEAARPMQIGEFIGHARKTFPQLSNSHENELYDWLTEGSGKNLTQRSDFMQRVENIVQNITFKPDEPLNIAQRVTRGVLESEIVQQINDVNKQIKDLEKERKTTTSKERADEISREIGNLNKDLVRLNQKKAEAKAGDRAQTDIFGGEAAPEIIGQEVELTENYLGAAKGLKGTVIKETTVDGEKAYELDFGENAGGEKLKKTVPATYIKATAGKLSPEDRLKQKLQEFDEGNVTPTGLEPEEKPKSEQLKEKEQAQVDKLKNLLDQFGKTGGKVTTGVDPEQFRIAGEIIKAAAELGITKFQQLVAWIDENYKGWLEKNYKALKSAYVSIKIGEGDTSEDYNRINTQEVKDAITEGKSQREATGGTTENVPETEEQQPVEPIPGEEGRPPREDVSGPEETGTGRTPGERDSLGGSDVITTDGSGVGGNTELNQDLGGRSGELDVNQEGEGIIDHIDDGGNFVVPPDFEYKPFNKTAKYNDNLEAIRVLRDLKDEDRPATQEEKNILFRYVGWGGLKEFANPENQYAWSHFDKKYYEVVKSTKDVIRDMYGDQASTILRQADETILNAHYTPVTLIRSIYKGLRNMGLKGNLRILEPSAGIGNYLGAMPASMRNGSTLHATEIDRITGDILEKLYEGANIKKVGLEKAGFPSNYFDLVVSNIPFGKYNVSDYDFERKGPRQKRATQKIHNYFFAKGLDLVRPGGVISFITTTGVLDSQANKFLREHIAEKAEFLGAIKLPSSTFKDNAGTQVTTDLIFLRKFEKGEQNVQQHSFINSIKPEGKKYWLNEYFIKNPAQMLGQMYGDKRYSLEGVPETYEKIENIAPNVTIKPSTTQGSDVESWAEIYKGDGDYVRKGNLVIQGKKMGMIDDQGRFVPVSYGIPLDKMQAFIDLRTNLNHLIASEISDADDIEQLRKSLNNNYDEWVDVYGRLNIPGNVKFIKEDIDSFNILALENLDEDGAFLSKADIFNKRTIKSMTRPTTAADPKMAIGISLNELGRVDIPRIAELLDVDEKAVPEELEGMIYELPEGGYVSAEEYLSGNVKQKLRDAEAAAAIDERFKVNVEALKEVQPSDIPITLISKRLASHWVPIEHIAEFITETYGVYHGDVSVFRGEHRADVDIKIKHIEYNPGLEEIRTNRMSPTVALNNAANDKYPIFTDEIEKGKRVVNEAETQAAKQAIDSIKEKFSTWANTSERAPELQKIYNEFANTSVARSWDGSHINPIGYAGPSMRQHQKDATFMITYNNGGIVDHLVGGGKTLVMAVAAMELKRMGTAQKPTIVAPLQTLKNTANTAKSAFPAANILYLDSEMMSEKVYKSSLAKVATNNWDLVIMSKEALQKISPSPEIIEAVVNEELERLEVDLEAVLSDPSMDSRTQKRVIRTFQEKKKKLEAEIDRAAKLRKDTSIPTFDRLGIDHLFIDESHNYKNLRYTTKFGQVAGLGDPKGSQRANDLMFHIRYLQKLHRGDKGVTMLSGTTITNSLVEMYNILNYLRPNRLKEMGINTFDQWAGVFADQASDIELTVAGDVKEKRRFRRFTNVPELSLLYNEIADVRNDSNLKLPKPTYLGGKPILVKIPQGREENIFTKRLLRFARQGNYERLGLGPGTEGMEKAKMLVITDLAAKMSVDLRMLFGNAPPSDVSKIAYVANSVKDHYDQWTKYKGTQLVFLNLQNGHRDNGFNSHQAIKEMLMKKGVPDKEIAFMGDYKDASKRQALFDEVNAGNVRVVIGHKETMGTGVNLQQRVVAVHMVDIDWKPAPHEQAIGRALRQGNWLAMEHMGGELPVYYYGLEKSLDALKFNLIDIKDRFIKQIKDGTIGDRVVDEQDEGTTTMGEIMAALTGNDSILDKSKVEKRLNALNLEKRVFEQKKYDARRNIATLKARAEGTEKQIPKFEQDIAAREERKKVDDKGEFVYEVTIEGDKHTNRKEAGQHIVERAKVELEAMNPGAEKEIGNIYGFPIVFQRKADGLGTQFVAWYVKGDSGLLYKWGDNRLERLSYTDEKFYENTGRFPLDALRRMDQSLQDHKDRLDNIARKIEVLKKDAESTWEKDADIKELDTRLEELTEEIKKYDLGDDFFEGIDEPLFDEGAAYNAVDKGKSERSIDDFARRKGEPGETGDVPFKIYARFIELARKWAPKSNLGQGRTQRGSIGSYFGKGKHIRVEGMNDFDVGIHELTHAVDDEYGITQNIIDLTDRGDPIRKRLTDIYEEFYPNAKREHPLRKRMVEGLAVLTQFHTQDPTRIKRKYGDLVADILTPGGQYAFEGVGDYMKDIEDIILEYQALAPLQKVGAHVATTRLGKPRKEKLKSTLDVLEEEGADFLHFIEKKVKESGDFMTDRDIAQFMRFVNNNTGWSANNIDGKNEEYHGFNEEGELEQKYDFNYRTIRKRLAKRGAEEDFAYWLYARRIHNDYVELNNLYDERDTLEGRIANLTQRLEEEELSKLEEAKLTDQISGLQNFLLSVEREIERIEDIVKNEGITELTASTAYEDYRDEFAREAEMLDKLLLEDLKLLHLAQIVDTDFYNKYAGKEGYIPFKRVQYDEALGVGFDPVPEAPQTKGTGSKVASTMYRAGNSKPIINPFIAAQINHQDIMRKATRQMVYNRLFDFADKFPELFAPARYAPGIEKDKNVIIARQNYKKKVLVPHKYIKEIIDENFSIETVGPVATAFLAMSRVFRAGTTGAFPPFVVANTTLDQISAFVNSRTGFIPFLSPAINALPGALGAAKARITKRINNTFHTAITVPQSLEAKLFKEYTVLAGYSHTYIRSHERTFKSDMEKKVDKWKGYSLLKNVYSIAELPGLTSEIMTRATEYIRARKAGHPQFVSLEMAGRVSTPFHHIGRLKAGFASSAKPALRSIPYFGASIQVLHQMMRTARESKEGRIRLLFAITSLAAMALASTLKMLRDDDLREQLEALKAEDPETLSKYWFLPNVWGKKGNLIKIRVPENYNFLGAISNMLLMEMYGETKYSPWEYLDASTSWVPTQLNVFEGEQALWSWLPPVVKTPIEISTETKTYPSIRPMLTEAEKYGEPYQQYNEWTSPVAIAIGKQFNWSPKKIDHFVTGIFGRASKYLLMKPGVWDMESYFFREMYVNGSRQVVGYYDMKDKIDRRWNDIKKEKGKYSAEEEANVKSMLDLVYGKTLSTTIIRTGKYAGQPRISRAADGVDDLLRKYDSISLETERALAIKTRQMIFDKINALERLYYK